MASNDSATGGSSGGGYTSQPWQSIRVGAAGGVESEHRMPPAIPTQGLSSTGIGGGFAVGSWPGRLQPIWKRGFFGGSGERGAAR